MIETTFLNANASSALNEYAYPASITDHTMAENTTQATALAASIFVSGRVGWDSNKGRSRVCALHGISLCGPIATDPATVDIVDAAGTTQFSLILHDGAGGFAIWLPTPVIINPAVGGIGFKTLVADATLRFNLHWTFYT